MWIFTTKTKQPLIQQVEGHFKQLKAKLTVDYCSLTTDLGVSVELAKLFKFQKMVEKAGYVLKTTGAFSSAQNGLPEHLNQDLDCMVRALLYALGK